MQTDGLSLGGCEMGGGTSADIKPLQKRIS